jgi:hypothetical protein
MTNPYQPPSPFRSDEPTDRPSENSLTAELKLLGLQLAVGALILALIFGPLVMAG